MSVLERVFWLKLNKIKSKKTRVPLEQSNFRESKHTITSNYINFPVISLGPILADTCTMLQNVHAQQSANPPSVICLCQQKYELNCMFRQLKACGWSWETFKPTGLNIMMSTLLWSARHNVNPELHQSFWTLPSYPNHRSVPSKDVAFL